MFLKEPDGLAEGEEGSDINLGRPDGFKVKWGTDVNENQDGKKSGKFIWHGTIDPGKEVVLVSKWEIRAPVDVEWIEKASVSSRSILLIENWIGPNNSNLIILSSKPFYPAIVYLYRVFGEKLLDRTHHAQSPP